MMRYNLQNIELKSPNPRWQRLKKALLPIAFCLLAIGTNAQTCDLTVQKTGPNSVAFGAPMSYTITIANNGPSAVTGATFNDPLPAFVSNVMVASCTPSGGASCPVSPTVSSSMFSGTVDLPVSGSLVIVLSMDAPSTSYTGTSFSNTITVSPPSGTTEIDNSTNTSTWNTTLSGGGGTGTADIGVTKTNSPTTSFNNANMPGSINYTVTWTNHSANSVSNVNLIDEVKGQNEVYTGTGNGYIYYDGVPTNLVWSTTSSATSTPSGSFSNPNSGLISGPKVLNAIVANWAAGESITLTYTLDVSYSNFSACGRNLAYEINNSAYFSNVTDPNSSNDYASVVNQFLVTSSPCNTTDIQVSTTNASYTNIGSCSNLPTTINYSIKWKNDGLIAANGTILYVDLKRILLNATGNGNASYSYPYSISNVAWNVTGSSPVPTNTSFSNYGGGGPGSGNSGTIGVNNNGNNSQFAYLQTNVNVWDPGDEITLTFSLTINSPTINDCGMDINFLIRCNPFVQSVPANITDTQPSNNSANIDNEISCTSNPCLNTDLEIFSISNKVGGCGSPTVINDTIYYINHGPSVADGSSIQNQLMFAKYGSGGSLVSGTGTSQFNFPWTFSNILWYSNNNIVNPYMTGNTNGVFTPGNNNYTTIMFFNGNTTVNSWAVGDTIRLTYTLTIDEPSITGGCNRNTDFDVLRKSEIGLATGLTDTDLSNNESNIYNPYKVEANFKYSSVDLSISKSVSAAITNHLDSLTMTTVFQNAPGGATASSATFVDTLPNVFSINPATINCTASGGANCAVVNYDPLTRIITQTITNFPAGGSVIITYNGEVNSHLTKTYKTKAYANVDCGGDCVPATNVTQSNFQINGDKNAIGNYVWKDVNDNGIQDNTEPAMKGVTVSLFSSTNNLIATATTDSNGLYSFASVLGTSTSSAIYNLSLTPGQNYFVKVTSLGTDPSVAGLSLTGISSSAPGETSGNTNTGTTTTNNDAFIISGLPTIKILLGALGTNNESYDFGFKPTAPCPIPNCGTATSIKN